MTKISIYQVLPRLFGNTTTSPVPFGNIHQNGTGKMNDFSNKALKEIKNMGITHIWYTGIIEHARCQGNPSANIPDGFPQIIKGKAGSPYAITDYYDVDPDLANNVPDRINEFEQLIERTHAENLKAIIDFVPNHVARVYHSDVYPDKDFGLHDDKNKAFDPANDFYYLPNEKLELQKDMGTPVENKTFNQYEEFPAKATGNDKFTSHPDISDWYETVKLNYGVDYQNGGNKYFEPTPPLWDKMVDILLFWCQKGIDGFRCDMVEMVPVEFWAYAIPRVKKEFKHIIFIAEVYQPSLYEDYLVNGKFDYLYDKVGLYDTLRGILSGNDPAENITKCWQSINEHQASMLRFMENHDEQRIASEFFANNPFKAMPAMVVCATLHTGPVMIYFGQELGEPAKGESGFSGNDGRTTIFDYWKVPEHQKWVNNGKFNEQLLSKEQKKLRKAYIDLFQLAVKSDAIGKGRFYDLMWYNDHENSPNKQWVYSYIRYYKSEALIIAVNFNASENQKFALKVPPDALEAMKLDLESNYTFNAIYGENPEFKASGQQLTEMGFWVNLAPSGAIVLSVIKK